VLRLILLGAFFVTPPAVDANWERHDLKMRRSPYGGSVKPGVAPCSFGRIFCYVPCRGCELGAARCENAAVPLRVSVKSGVAPCSFGRIFCGVPQKTGVWGGSRPPKKKNPCFACIFFWPRPLKELPFLRAPSIPCARTGSGFAERIAVAPRPLLN
jgi:hypothetical protein